MDYPQDPYPQYHAYVMYACNQVRQIVKAAGALSQRYCEEKIMEEGGSTLLGNIVKRGVTLKRRCGMLVAS